MEILRTIEDVRRVCKAARRVGRTVGLTPTMGALHEGHLALVRTARESCDFVVATIFVNPTQFGAGEDFASYPRTFEADCEMLAREGVDVLFAPAREEMYPAGAGTWVDVPGVGGRLDGASRPGHFRGVSTVVTKLLHIVGPDKAFFGQKDGAQVAVIQAMVRDLNFDVEIVVCPTVRERDGLAMSSRNRNLNADERERAVVLSGALGRVERAVEAGLRDVGVLREILRDEMHGVRVDYAEIVDPRSLEVVEDVRGGALVAVAAWVGETRLIDNVVIAAEASR